MPATRPRPSARELLGGRWAVSLRVWLIGSVLALLFPFFSLRAILHADAPALVGLVLAQWAAVSAVYLIVHLTAFRNRLARPVPLVAVVALAVLLGAVRVAAVFALEALPGGEHLTPVERLALVLGIVPGTALVFLLATYLVAIEDWFATERAQLLRFEIDAEAARLKAIGALDATRAVTTARIREEIEEQLAALETARQPDAERARLSGAVLEAAAGYVRPTSHALWGTGAAATPRIRLREIERLWLVSPLPILLPFAIWLGITLPFGLARNGPVPTTVSALAVLGGMLVCYPLGSRAIRRFAPVPHVGWARLLVLISIAAATVPLLLTHLRAEPRTSALFGAAALLVLVTTVGVAMVRSMLDAQNARLGDLRSHAEEAEFRRLALEAATEQMQRDLARYLHGTVQAGLVAAAYAIQDAASRGDDVALERAIAEARATAARVGEHASPIANADLDAKRGEIDETWQGMLDLTWSLPATDLDAAMVERIGNVVQECLANASIHGGATEASVRIVTADEQVIVEITDNGSGLGDGKPGLGSAVLNEATAGTWTIASVPTGGAQVRAVVPV